jgi:hypothetical protein
VRSKVLACCLDVVRMCVGGAADSRRIALDLLQQQKENFKLTRLTWHSQETFQQKDSGSRIQDQKDSGSRIQGQKKFRIPDPRSERFRIPDPHPNPLSKNLSGIFNQKNCF